MEVLRDKSYKNYTYISRYSGVPYYYHSFDDRYVYGTTFQLSENTPFQTYEVRVGDTLDNLALHFYGAPIFYWVIADFNRIRDPFIKLTPGDRIRIPTLTMIEFDRS